VSWSRVCADDWSARDLRADARTYLERYAEPLNSDLDGAEQIVGELLSNVVRHGAPPFGACIDWHAGQATFCISDRGSAKRLLYTVPDSEAESGRGLLLVRALGGQFVVEPPSCESSGLRVVVRLPVWKRARTVAA